MHRGGGRQLVRLHLRARRPRDRKLLAQSVGIDRGEPSTAVYALHATVGHHGIFSLTPIWLLSVAGLGIWLCRRGDRAAARAGPGDRRGVAGVPGLLPVHRERRRNYGGMTSGFRWMFWLAPLWLVAMLPAADAMSRWKATRLVTLVLLAVSVASASYPTWNPWMHPWLLEFLHVRGVDTGVKWKVESGGNGMTND